MSPRKGAVIKAQDEGNAANWEMKEEEVKGNSSTFQIRWTWLLCAFWLHYFLFIILQRLAKRGMIKENGKLHTVCPCLVCCQDREDNDEDNVEELSCDQTATAHATATSSAVRIR